MRFTSLYVSTFSEAEEVVSDTFLTLWENRYTLPELTNFNAYIYTVARRKAISAFRKQHFDEVPLDDIPIDLFSCTDTTPEDDMISQESISRLNAAIEELPDKCKMAFKLVREDKLKYKEVAAILEISVKTLENHLANAVKKLRIELSKENRS